MNTEPILSSSGIVAAISAIVAMLMGFGVLQWAPEQRDLVMAAIVAILGVVGPLAAGFWARTQTTPLVSPKDADGEILIRASGGPALRSIRPVQGR